ncbi:MAG: carboxylating nicotinate-nucleotide diphosphorylase [Nitrospiraceae bacterium]|nr:carboxylating nicotinate-nucleotide diphosphorylase [Nitrospiraceae bacterium]
MALEEDIGHGGDITTRLLLADEKKSAARLIAKGDFIVAGLPFAGLVFRMVDELVDFKPLVREGSKARKNTVLAEIKGRTASLLAAERVSLNILQRLSGIATLTGEFVRALRGLDVRLCDTRKTTPAMRYLEKYAVRKGGGSNHRFGLFDGVLIKDNHIDAVGGTKKAVGLAKAGAPHLMKIEVETRSLPEVREALDAGADVIMLDNMDIEEMRRAVKLCGKRALVEASGNVTLENVRGIAETGVDLISTGLITHSAPAADISMRIKG